MNKRFILAIATVVCFISVFTLVNGISAKAEDIYREPNRDSEGRYVITCGGELKWYADGVNENRCNTDNAILNNDINISKYEWDSIGLSMDCSYRAVFDGNNKKITGINCSYRVIANAGDTIGLFGYNEGTIKNLCIEDGNINNNKHIGAICGYNRGTIENCISKVSVISNKSAAGICCFNEGKINKVGNEGYICGIEASGICAENRGEIANAYNAGEIEGRGIEECNDRIAGICARNDRNINNVYNIGKLYETNRCDIYSLADRGVNNGYDEINEDELHNGKFTYILNSNISNANNNEGVENPEEGIVWRQRIGKDDYPTFYGDIVYYGYVKDTCTNPIYSNEKLYGEPMHMMNSEYEADGDNHFHKCKNCDYIQDVENHIYNDGWKFLNSNEHANTCNKCGIQITRAHNWTNRTVVKEPTVETPGECTYTCSECNCTRKTQLLVDAGLPTGQFQMDSTFFSGLFNGNKKKVTIASSDDQTGIASVEYALLKEETSDFSSVNWTKYERMFKVNIKDYPGVYAKITDNSGNYIIIDKENKVVYSEVSTSNNIYEGNSEVFQ